MNIVFMGTPEFSVPCLRELIAKGYNISCVVTQPDKKGGRGRKIIQPPIKKLAEKYGLRIIQPKRVSDAEVEQTLLQLSPDLIVTVAYGQILKENILNIPKKGCVNVHASLLPRYRGAAPIQAAIINGDRHTGITTMFMDQGLDTGDIILQKSICIGENETAGELHDRLSVLGAQVLIDTIELIREGNAKGVKQKENNASYFPMIKKHMALIDWTKKAVDIKNMVRAFNPWPGAYTYKNGKRLKIWAVGIAQNGTENVRAGEVLEASVEKGIIVSAGRGKIIIKEIQPENSIKMDSSEFVKGYSIKKGDVFSV
ncbi:MAG: methionyl-tRNA formyltransferase [Clostridia bacterium]|nr:methionyl-tRNA formyltransferase [Clostridia bacterium]